MAFERIETTLLVLFALVVTISTFPATLHARQLTALVQKQPLTLTYHKGYLLTGPRVVHLIWYGNFTISQRAVISDFVTSLSSTSTLPPPSVATWWTTVEKYHHQTKTPKVSLSLGPQTFDPTSSLGKRLTSSQLLQLASRGGRRRAINVVLTAADVAVEGFCMSRCGTHGSSPRSKKGRYAYLWVGNSAVQCPGHCAWPFHQPIYGPQTPPLLSPNGDVGADGMVINLAKLLVGAVTNPFGDGFYQGEKGAEMDVASACNGVFGKGAYPGYPGKVLVDGVNGGSYNANGVNGRKYLLPAMVDPNSAMCSTLV